jgi:hypothetical protein
MIRRQPMISLLPEVGHQSAGLPKLATLAGQERFDAMLVDSPTVNQQIVVVVVKLA